MSACSLFVVDGSGYFAQDNGNNGLAHYPGSGTISSGLGTGHDPSDRHHSVVVKENDRGTTMASSPRGKVRMNFLSQIDPSEQCLVAARCELMSTVV